jgi:hypothetical protein
MKKAIPFLIIAGGVLLTGLAAFIFFFLNSTEQPGRAPLPPAVAGLPLLSSTAGQAAAEDINRLHRQEFAMSAAAVGVYGRNQATLWAASGSARSSTAQMLTDMVVKIDQGKSPFTPLGQRQEGQITVYELSGMGQKHFYFQSGQMLIWLAADFDLAEAALSDTLAYYR